MNNISQNGIINIFKEKDYTSHDVIARLRGILKIRKMGHTGTLDPDAEGVLPICLGKATKLSDFLTDSDKTYKAKFILGLTTNTQDISGQILSQKDVNISIDDLKAVIEKYVGSYEQLPPMYSALRVNGIRLYKLAYQGIEIERKTRPVKINKIELLNYNSETFEGEVLVDCGKGTYIRTLIHDIGNDLKCGATTKELSRTRAGDFHINNSLSLSQVEDLVRNKSINDHIMAIDKALDIYPSLTVCKDDNTTIQNGNPLKCTSFINYNNIDFNKYMDLVRIYDYKNNFIGLYKYSENKDMFVVAKMFI